MRRRIHVYVYSYEEEDTCMRRIHGFVHLEKSGEHWLEFQFCPQKEAIPQERRRKRRIYSYSMIL
jgi:hypothetical protein